jgi:hypothetical protein
MKNRNLSVYLTVAILCLLASSWPSKAQVVVGQYVFGDLQASCGEYLEAAEREQQARTPDAKPTSVYDRHYLSFISTVDGFLSGANYTDPIDKFVGKNSEHAGRMAWLANYCREKPLAYFADAVIGLRDELAGGKHH